MSRYNAGTIAIRSEASATDNAVGNPGTTLAIFATAIVGFGLVQQQFFPNSTRLELLVDLRLPEGSSLRATQAEVDAGADDSKFVTALKLMNWVKQAGESVLGLMKVATQAQTDAGTADDVALRGIEAMEDFYREIKMPTSIHELGIDPGDDELKLMAHKCSIGCKGSKGSAKVLHEEDMYEIYKAAL